MDDYEECAEVCERRGFVRQAEWLRSVGRGQATIFVVAEHPVAADNSVQEEDGGEPVAVYLRREDAETDALRRNVRAFRERNLLDCCGGYLEDLSELTRADLERRIGEILGVAFSVPDPEHHRGSLFPDGTTDLQLRALMDLFTLRFFYVAEARLAGRDGEAGPGEARP